MTDLRVLVDMDDCLENFCEVWTQIINERNGTHVRHSDVTQWDMAKVYPSLTPEQIYSPIQSDELWERVTPIPGAVEYLKKIMDDDFEVMIVTTISDIGVIDKKLKNGLFKYFPYLSLRDVTITTKKQYMVGDIMIDDAPHNLEGGHYTKLLFTAPHNKSYDAEANGMVRVDTWEDIYKYITNYRLQCSNEQEQ